MDYPGVNSWSGGVPHPQQPELDMEYDLQWVDFSEDLEEFGRMGTCTLAA